MTTPIKRRYLANQYGAYVFDGIKDAENLRETLAQGFEELTFEQFIERVQATKSGSETEYQRLQRMKPTDLIKGYPSIYVLRDDGVMTTQSTIDQEAEYRRQLAAGALVEIAPGKYVPTGSPADTGSPAHITTIQTPEGIAEEIPKEFWNEALRQLKAKGLAMEKQYKV